MTSPLDSEGQARAHHIDQKVETDKTGLRGSLHIHVDYVDGSRGKEITGVRFSERGRDGSTLDKALTAIGDALTAIIREEINQPPAPLTLVHDKDAP